MTLVVIACCGGGLLMLGLGTLFIKGLNRLIETYEG